jgi:hypothetical protein
MIVEVVVSLVLLLLTTVYAAVVCFTKEQK